MNKLLIGLFVIIACFGCGGGGGAGTPPIATLEQVTGTTASGGSMLQLSAKPATLRLAPSALPDGEAAVLAAQDFTGFLPAGEHPVTAYSFLVQVPAPSDPAAEFGSLEVPTPAANPSASGYAWAFYQSGDLGVIADATFDPVGKKITVPLNGYMLAVDASRQSRSTPTGTGRFTVVLDPSGSHQDPFVKFYRWVPSGDSWEPITSFQPDTKIALITHGIKNRLVSESLSGDSSTPNSKDDLAKFLENLTVDGRKVYDQIVGVDYQWRAHIQSNAALVGQRLRDYHRPGVRIDLYGHSMGGLVFRTVTDYILPSPGSYGIERLFTLGTPHEGIPAPRALRVLMGGDTTDGFDNDGVRDLFSTSTAISTLAAAPGDASIEYIFLAGSNWDDYGWKGRAVDIVYNPFRPLGTIISHDGIVPVDSAWANHLGANSQRRGQRLGLYNLGHSNMGGTGSSNSFSLERNPASRAISPTIKVRGGSGVVIH